MCLHGRGEPDEVSIFRRRGGKRVGLRSGKRHVERDLEVDRVLLEGPLPGPGQLSVEHHYTAEWEFAVEQAPNAGHIDDVPAVLICHNVLVVRLKEVDSW